MSAFDSIIKHSLYTALGARPEGVRAHYVSLAERGTAFSDGDSVVSLEDLAWDSGLFGFKVGSLPLVSHADGSDPTDLVRRACEQARKNGLRVVYAKLPRNDRASVAAVEKNGFARVSPLLTFSLQTRRDFGEENGVASPCPEELEQVVAIARGAFPRSRFYKDKRFGQKLADALHEKWVRDAQNSDKRFLLVKNDREVCGFILYRVKKAAGLALCIIELIAVKRGEEGKGHGSRLIELMKKEKVDADLIVVGTQADNKEAIAFYEKHGFARAHEDVDMHLWL